MSAGTDVASSRTIASDALHARALGVMPGGVNSPVRAFHGVGGTPRFIERAQGARMIDADGNELIDLIGSWGAMIAGHAHPAVVEAIERAARDGTSFGACSRLEIELGEEIIRRVPSIERVRMVSSGTEAVMSALRLARAATGRPLVVRFDGCYHGHSDGLLSRAGSGLATQNVPSSPGVTAGAAASTLGARFNDADSVEDIFEARPGEIAAVIVEPVAGNMGLVPPEPGFLEALRELATRHGALLVFDEVMTGFRVGPGGAQDLYGIKPDLTTFGKVIGGGLPVGAYAGRADLMDLIAPAGPVYQAGTLSGNPLAMSAGLTTLRLLDDDAYARLERMSSRLETGLRDAVGGAGEVQRVGSMLSVFFNVECVRDFDAAKSADHERFARFFHAMLERGVHLPPSGYEAWFVSLAHDATTIDAAVEAARESLAVI